MTIQPEYTDHKSPEVLCSAPCISKACDPQLCCSQREAAVAQMNGYSEKNGGLSPILQKAYKKDSVEIAVEPMWADDVVKKDSYKKTADVKPYVSSTQF